MPDYDNTNRGAIFKNDRKEKDTHPDRTGTINVEGREYWISGWIKATRDGDPFLSLSVKPKDEGGNRQRGQGPGRDRTPADGYRAGSSAAPRDNGGGSPDDVEDDIPFAPHTPPLGF